MHHVVLPAPTTLALLFIEFILVLPASLAADLPEVPKELVALGITPTTVQRSRTQWTYIGQERPKFAVEPGQGEESVWDYPRPPRLEAEGRTVVVKLADGTEVARSTRAMRVLETSHPPTVYVPREDVNMKLIKAAARPSSLCEWKGLATGFSIVGGAKDAGWFYGITFPEFDSIAKWLAFYPSKVQCFLDKERVQPQAGGYYGGWITKELVGPFKGEPGTQGM